MGFTGSPEVGRLVAEACGRNLTPVKLELGGKGAAVVFDDVDIETTADQLMGAITFHSGQVCDAYTLDCQARSVGRKTGNIAAREEIFGPVAYLASFDDEEQAIAMVNESD